MKRIFTLTTLILLAAGAYGQISYPGLPLTGGTLTGPLYGTSAHFTGAVSLGNGSTAVTQTVGDSSTNVATTAFVAANAPVIVATANVAGLTASTNAVLYTVPAGVAGQYRISCFLVLTTGAPTTTSSTLPGCQVYFYDEDTNNLSEPVFLSGEETGNVVGTNTVGSPMYGNTFNAHAGTNISWATPFYASSPANTMAYTAHFKLEYLGQ